MAQRVSLGVQWHGRGGKRNWIRRRLRGARQDRSHLHSSTPATPMYNLGLARFQALTPPNIIRASLPARLLSFGFFKRRHTVPQARKLHRSQFRVPQPGHSWRRIPPTSNKQYESSIASLENTRKEKAKPPFDHGNHRHPAHHMRLSQLVRGEECHSRREGRPNPRRRGPH